MLRFRSNCSVTRVLPLPLFDVTSLTPAITPRRRSSGVATLLAMVCGLAPGKFAETEITGKSTCGSEATGSRKKAAMPASAIQIVSSTVPTGRRTKGEDRFMPRPRSLAAAGRAALAHRGRQVDAAFVLGRIEGGTVAFRRGGAVAAPAPAVAQAIEAEIDHRGGEQREQLADDQAAEDGEAQRPAQLGALPEAEHQRDGREQRRQRRHQDRA